MTNYSARVTLGGLLFMGSTACSDSPLLTAPVVREDGIAAASAADIPPRGADSKFPSWSSQSDVALWEEAARLDTLFAIGIKTPGASRGFYKTRRLVTPDVWKSAQQALRERSDVEIVRIDTILPVARVKIRSIQALATIRRLPFVDYLEPLLVSSSELSYSSTSGCDYPNESPIDNIDSYGDVIAQSLQKSFVDRAWYYAPEAGAGVTIGLVDTGVNQQVTDLGSDFSTGLSSGRSFWQTSSIGASGTPSCSHGTRMAGVIAAPRNGRSVVGVAFRANLYSSWAQNYVTSVNGVDQSQAIRDAVNGGAKVVSMAWSTDYRRDLVDDEINYGYYQRDVMFVGAAGTTAADLNQNLVLFPAEKQEVFAASAAGFSGARDNQSHYGPELDIVAYEPVTTVGAPGRNVDVLGNSSSATAVVAGVAALVRAHYPFMGQYQVMARIRDTAGSACGIESQFGPIVHAEAAVGGLCTPAGSLSGPSLVEFYDRGPNSKTVHYAVTHSGGIGPFSYYWNQGTMAPDGRSITVTWYRPPTAQDDLPTVMVEITDQAVSAPPKRLIKQVRIVNWAAYPCDQRPDATCCGPGC